MKANPACFFAGVLLLAANDRVYPQYAPPPAPFRGFLNEALRANNPYLSQWDIGGSARVRFEARQGFGIPGIAGSLDFREHGVDVDNEYFLERIRYRVGDADKWWSALVEGRTSFAQGDQRFACPNTPPAPGSSAYNGLGPESDTLDCIKHISRRSRLWPFLRRRICRQQPVRSHSRLARRRLRLCAG